jgi:eukaryotic-like serine/threonine-protein kinase
MSTDREPAAPRIIQFPPFELDVRAAELRKHGIKVRLHDQPFRILVSLLSRPGEVVLREEIRKLLWPDDTVVEFDRSINAAVQRLRDALGDSAENPRYVETLARRGYRFIGALKPTETEAREKPPETETREEAPEPPVVPRRRNFWPAAAGLCLLAAVAAVLWRPQPALERPVEFEVLAPPDSAFTDFFQATAVSPDGRWIVFKAGTGPPSLGMLWLRPLDSPVARPLPGTDGVGFPFWAPDSKSLAFFTGRSLKRIDLAGGPPLTLCDAPQPDGGSWSSEGVLLFASGRSLWRVPAAGGTPLKVLEPDAARDEIDLLYPQFLPDGKRFLYQVKSLNPNTKGIYADRLDHPGERRRLLATNYKAVYAAPRGGHPGTLFWLRELALMTQGFDAASLRLTGEPVALVDQIAVNRLSHAAFWVSDAGIVAYRTGEFNSRLTWINRDGKTLDEVVPVRGGRFDALTLSPDGKRVALARTDPDNDSDIWIYEFARKTMTRLTYGAGPVDAPVWSPDGRQIAFSSGRSGTVQIFRRNADGSGVPDQLTDGPAEKYPNDWSRDGRYLVYYQRSVPKVFEVWALPLEGAPNPVPLLQAPFQQSTAAVSADGKWIAYEATESGKIEVYVRPFSIDSPARGSKVQISNATGGWPRWRADGKEIFYHLFTSRPRLMAAAVRVGKGGLEAEAPVELFFFAGTATPTARLWDVAADGQRFLTTGQVGGLMTAQRLHVVVNWQARVNKVTAAAGSQSALGNWPAQP